MVVVVYFGGRATLWANFDDYRMGGREYMHQFHGHFLNIFFLPGKHIYCTHFMETILSDIVQHVLKSNANFLPFIL